MWESALGGVYSGIAGLYPSIPSSDIWSASSEFIGSSVIVGKEVTGTKWSGNEITGYKIEGTMRGYGADTTIIPTTWVSVGEVMGTFDPTLYTFQVESMGVAIETNTFLNMVTDNPSALEALKIPCFAVGATDLRGSWSNGGNSIDMGNAADAAKGILNATFFAPSTGGKPQIWASGNVNGAFTGSPTGGSAVYLVTRPAAPQVRPTGSPPTSIFSSGMGQDGAPWLRTEQYRLEHLPAIPIPTAFSSRAPRQER